MPSPHTNTSHDDHSRRSFSDHDVAANDLPSHDSGVHGSGTHGSGTYRSGTHGSGTYRSGTHSTEAFLQQSRRFLSGHEHEVVPSRWQYRLVAVFRVCVTVLAVALLVMIAWSTFSVFVLGPAVHTGGSPTPASPTFTPIEVVPVIVRTTAVRKSQQDVSATSVASSAAAGLMLPVRLAMAQSLLAVNEFAEARPILRQAVADAELLSGDKQRQLTYLLRIASWQVTADDIDAANATQTLIATRCADGLDSWSDAARDAVWLSLSTLQWRLGLWQEAEESLTHIRSQTLRLPTAQQLIVGYQHIDRDDDANRVAAQFDVVLVSRSPNGETIETFLPTWRVALLSPTLQANAAAKIATLWKSLKYADDTEAARVGVALTELFHAIKGRGAWTPSLVPTSLFDTVLARVRSLPAGRLRSELLGRLAVVCEETSSDVESPLAMVLVQESLIPLGHLEMAPSAHILATAVAVAARCQNTERASQWIEQATPYLNAIPPAEQARLRIQMAESIVPLGDIELTSRVLNDAVAAASRVGLEQGWVADVATRRLRDASLETVVRGQIRLAVLGDAVETIGTISERVIRDRLYQLVVYERLAMNDCETASTVAAKLSNPTHRTEVLRAIDLIRRNANSNAPVENKT
ncbi:MAG: hypothetical protein ACRC46_10125 [Thermoguttaceae bacterium]